MKILKFLGISLEKNTSRIDPQEMPLPDSVIDVFFPKSEQETTIGYRKLQGQSFLVQSLSGMKRDESAVFTYYNDLGHFRFCSRCLSVGDDTATYEVPEKIETLRLHSRLWQRSTVRLDTIIPAVWRYVKDGHAVGIELKGTISDVSCSGVALVTDRKVSTDCEIEVCFSFNKTKKLYIRGFVRRCSQITTTKKFSLGVQFIEISNENQRAISEFIYQRKIDQRKRGLA
jgi:PilZ domain